MCWVHSSVYAYLPKQKIVNFWDTERTDKILMLATVLAEQNVNLFLQRKTLNFYIHIHIVHVSYNRASLNMFTKLSSKRNRNSAFGDKSSRFNSSEFKEVSKTPGNIQQ